MTLKEAKQKAEELNRKFRATFPGFNKCVMLQTDEGSMLFIRNAFIIKDGLWIYLFAEHHAPQVFHEEEATWLQLSIDEVSADWPQNSEELGEQFDKNLNLWNERDKVVENLDLKLSKQPKLTYNDRSLSVSKGRWKVIVVYDDGSEQEFVIQFMPSQSKIQYIV